MASPQLENGHLKIANEVWEHIFRQDLSGAEFRVAGCILRYTWGWKKKECELSICVIAEWSDLSERAASRAAQSLEDRNMVNASRGSGRGHLTKWSFNKDWESWKKGEQLGTLSEPERVNNSVPFIGVKGEQSGSERVNNSVPFITKPVTLSGCKPKKAKGHQPPKAILKESKSNIGAKAPSETAEKHHRSPDAAYEIFCSEFAEHRGIPYRGTKGDFVQLTGLRKVLNCTCVDIPDKWQEAAHNYFASPQNKYTLADLCCRYDVFRMTRLDRFGKPESAGGQRELPPMSERLATEEDKKGYNPHAR